MRLVGVKQKNPSCRGEIETFIQSQMPGMFLLVLIHPTVRKKIPKMSGTFTSEHQWEILCVSASRTSSSEVKQAV